MLFCRPAENERRNEASKSDYLENPMNNRLSTWGLVLIISLGLLMTSCARTHVHKTVVSGPSYGPPPHAPAHGYRHKHAHGVVLVFDSGLGLYYVAGQRDVHFYKGHYYRYHGNRWQMTKTFGGKWGRAGKRSVPKVLHAKMHAKGKKAKKGKKGKKAKTSVQ